MKKAIQIIVLLFLVHGYLQAQEWVNISPGADSLWGFNGGYFLNKNEGWIKGGSRPANLWHTTNGGVGWQKQLESGENIFYNIQFTDSLHGWITASKTFFRTTNGGKNWQKYSTPDLIWMAFTDSLNGFAGHDSLYSTTDGGTTWINVKIDYEYRFSIDGIYAANNKNIWVLGEDCSSTTYREIIINSTDGGKQWRLRSFPFDVISNKICFKDSLHGYIIGTDINGYEGRVKTTSDGGTSWSSFSLPYSGLNDIVFVNDSTGWIVGNNGYISKTTDGGETWNEVPSGTTSDLRNIYIFNEGKVGYIIGKNSTLLKWDKTVDVKDEKKSITTSFDLYQNYPNPFNPTTTINFQIPNDGYVTLKVFDLLGREVASLVNEDKKAGYYGYNFDASKLSSGVYIYKITADNFVQSKKMLLMK
jgi:photosystem II stability/assembly factor-like uncharacterized protein